MQQTHPSIDAVSTETVTVLAGRADAGLVLVCDHADNALPAEYGTLGLEKGQLRRHIAYDIGAAEITRQMSARLGVPAVLSRFSRLLIDPNRGEDDPTLIMRLSDGAVVPGNRVLNCEERERRLARFYRPYHRAIAGVLDRCLQSGVRPAILSLHSFTESWKGVSRPWHAGVLWDKDRRLAGPLLEALYAENNLIVGDNEPYTGRLHGDTMWQHGTRRGIAHAIIEVRQDLIRDLAGQTAWAERLERIMRGLMTRSELRSDARGASPTFGEGMGAMRPLPGDFSSGAKGPPAAGNEERLRHEVEAAVFRRLVEHLRQRVDVQNIDLMNLAGFCRNCLGDWYLEQAGAIGLAMSRDEARERIYGMPYNEWRVRHQTEATPEQRAAFEALHDEHHGDGGERGLRG